MSDNIGWEKILAAALVTSFFTACLTEPVKAWIQHKLKRRELRRSIYSEIANNFWALQAQVNFANRNAEMKTGIGSRFALGYKRLAYDLAMKDATIYYSFSYQELYSIEDLYRSFEQQVLSQFNDDDQQLRNAEFVVHHLLWMVKCRFMSEYLMFKSSQNWGRRELRERLPLINYTDAKPPSSYERLHRQYDQFKYWIWRKRGIWPAPE